MCDFVRHVSEGWASISGTDRRRGNAFAEVTNVMNYV